MAILSTAVLVSSLVCSSALGHDYWFQHEGDQVVLYQGHRYSAHKGEDRVPYDAAIVQAAYCALETGDVTEVVLTAASPLRFRAGCAALFVQASSGFWSQTLTATINKPRTEVPGALRSWRSEEAVKYVTAWVPRLAAPLTAGLELVPLGNPLTLKPGDKMRLVAMWERKPRAGVVVAYDGNPRGVTGGDGAINIRIRHGGLQMIAGSFEEPLQNTRADKVVRSTILQLHLKE
jgi:nickel transport protein